ncbi:bifunctional 2-polyprenyl-6-hydroxyphenol methylase/3-demethylubiquinol 3-O-methyltransferase UbiG [Desulfovibrio sp. JC022]|uniref:class I SAM-dependent methyltransferase n=1 Tax=Desulfovibrio sp. JC022 TaxID=2593642 RepID=UPI0013D1513E|nr:class I SAM-dependent methyltransferase [Desulfovibrio sp. JC022]NDV23044.1 class I SAM-dependent methyltransferase [Desulfovibrio sp. JC022]
MLDMNNEEKHIANYLKGKYPNKVKSLFNAILKNEKTKTLEVGCGFGSSAVFFALKGKKVTATDLSETNVSQTKALSDRHNAGVRSLPLDATKPLNEKFDIVYSFDMYEHLPYDLQEAHLKAVYEMLESGGTFYVRAPHLHNIRQHIPEHIGLPTYSSISELGSKVGFKVAPFFGHTRFTTSMVPYVAVEKAIEKISTPETRYQMLKKVGMANVVVKLSKG